MRDVTRRHCLAGSASLALVAARPVWAASSRADQTVAALRDKLTRYHLDQQFTAVDAGRLVTDDPGINGGLRYDDTGVLDGYGLFVSQPAARVDDADQKDRPGVLPLFEIFAARGSQSDGAEKTADRYGEILLQVLELDPARLAFVSVPDFAQVSPALDRHGLLHGENVLFRDPDAARAAANGSGYFRAPGPSDGFWTAGVYYALNDDPGAVRDGASDGWIEIGEFSIDGRPEPTYGFGLERLAMALTGEMPSWQDREALLQERIAAERG